MLVLIVSDSHGRDICDEIFQIVQPDIALHAGDSMLDIHDDDLKNYTYIVRGNCDFSTFEKELVIKIDDKKILLVHGDEYLVNFTDKHLVKRAKMLNCEIVVHGHTHVVKNIIVDGIRIINPGSISNSRSNYEESYMVADTENFELVSLYSANTYRKIGEV